MTSHPLIILMNFLPHHTAFRREKLKGSNSRSPIIGYFAGLLRGTVGFGIDIIIDAITGLYLFIDIRAATIFAHGVLVLFIFGHAVIVH